MASESDTPNQNPVDAISKGDASKKSNNESSQFLGAETQIPPATIDTNNTQQDKQYRLDRKRFWIDVFTLFAVVFYGWVAYRQWDEMKSGVEVARQSADQAKRAAHVAESTLQFITENSRLDQRAWVGTIGVNKPDIKPVGNVVSDLRKFNNFFSPIAIRRSVFSGGAV